MPAYNAEKFIGEAIESIVNQSYTDWTLTIVNDGSVDETKKIIESYVQRYVNKIKLIDKKMNEGTVNALNTLLDDADGKYICWLSADDVYTKDMLKDSFQFLEENKNYDMVFADYEIINENSDFLRSSPFRRYREELKKGIDIQPYRALLTIGCCIHGCTVLAKKECFDLVGRFNVAYRYAHDYDMWLRMAAEFRIGYIDKIHVRGREYKTQISMQGHNGVDAIKVLLAFIQDSEKFQKLYEKSGIKDRSEALHEVIVGQLRTYKHKEKELNYLTKALLEDDSELLMRFRRKQENALVFRVVKILYEQLWNQKETFFADDSKDSYLEILCKINHVDAVLINKKAIRFNQFEGNTLERFNKGLIRSNDIVIGDVEVAKLYEWLAANGDGYYFKIVSKDSPEIRLAYTYYMYMRTDLVKELGISNIYDTKSDIWWQLISGIYGMSNEGGL